MQFQVGYILQAVRDELTNYAKKQNKQAEVSGLLSSLSTFNIQSLQNLQLSKKAPSLLAVAANIISRGRPTLPTIFLENYFEKQLDLTSSNEKRGSLSFPFKEKLEKNYVGEHLYRALHIVDPRNKYRPRYLNLSDTDSNFERSFLLDLIPEKYSYIAQLVEKQRTRESLTRDNNAGRLDFSFEIPYSLSRKTQNKFRQEIDLKHKKTYIIEIDGNRYHTDLIDDVKDFQIAQLSRNVTHIKENNVYQNTHSLIEKLADENYLKIIKTNFEAGLAFIDNPYTTLALAPLGVARIQYTLIRWLIANYESINTSSPLRLAIVEQDIPCGYLAISDLERLLYTLNDLVKSSLTLPKIETKVFCTEEFSNNPLHDGKKVERIHLINPKDFDLIIDISILHRESVFKESFEDFEKAIIIRSSHYTHYKTKTPVISAPPIEYRSLAEPLENEMYQVNEDAASSLKELLQNIFRKIDFREGQLPILNRALQLKSVIGLLPTGGGKSLTYQLAAILQPGTTIVIDPIRSLMIDQYNGLKEMGIDRCEFINSTLTTDERNYNQHELLAKGELLFLFVSPERFVIDEFRKALDNAMKEGHYFSYAVIDEVHCVSEWGHDFRTPYLNLGDNAQEFCLTYNNKSVPLFGLTATASFDVLADIERELNIAENDGNAVVRYENTVRDEINYIIQEVPVSYEGIENITERAVRERVGDYKQKAIFKIISQKSKTFETFNKLSIIEKIVSESFKSYLPISKRQSLIDEMKDVQKALFQYIEIGKEKLHISGDPFLISKKQNEKKYNYGIITFMPHRQGWLGIRNGNSSDGLYDKSTHVSRHLDEQNLTIHHFEDETLGYFMGSGDDENAKEIDKESFHHLDQFKKNEESLMIATKAFGMGIDKPDVRMTIHMNIPQSIESFVQEAGRAGRDGKISTSIILFTKSIDNKFHLDKEVLTYFHKNSFKGEIKERAMIYELRNHITFPSAKNIDKLTEALNDAYPNDSFEFILKVGRNDYANRVFVSTTTEVNVGCVYLDSQQIRTYHDLGDNVLCFDVVEWVKSKLPFAENTTVEAMRSWIEKQVVDITSQIGIEQLLRDMKIGEQKKLPIPFTNSYYSKRTKNLQQFQLNQYHLKVVLSTQVIISLISSEVNTREQISTILKKAVFENMDYPAFIHFLNIKDSNTLNELKALESPLDLELQRAYFIPRSQDDTAKAIYRLISIGVIDSYTIDYQNNLYTLQFTKKAKGKYFESLQHLIGRYTSRNVALKHINNLIQNSHISVSSGQSTEMSICLTDLTTFIYDKIKAKRLQAIDDMVKLCNTSITIKDLLEQNNHIKDAIYYYFNARYTRPGNIERTFNGDYEASMPEDYANELSPSETVEKYLGLVENTETGEFIGNVKHLRGSAMRMSRSYPEKSQYRILKAFSLFILGDSIKELLKEAKEEFIKGLITWKYDEDFDFNVHSFISQFKQRIIGHVRNYDPETYFQDIEDIFYSQYYSTWIKTFNNDFITK